MKIVNNMVAQVETEIVAGEIVRGQFSDRYYMVLKGGKALRLDDLSIQLLSDLTYKRTGIKPENVVITFEGIK